ncbi:hypothetical protein PSTT_14981 [Puccinia striiformis]|uniref:Protein kinase domain-containing protein n=1 Tax=Puccinia striiformis TaxID=27350 RepID=A0A2S4UKE6_9BASI|nr:hypothetical protein PSTT_14981 [Puccinia striiformis]
MAKSFPRSLQLTGLCSPKDATYTVCILLGNLPDCVTIPQDVERDDDNDGPRLFLHYNETDFTSLTVSALMERLHPELQPIIPAAYQALTTRYSLPMEVAEADDPTNIKVVFYLMCVHPHAFVQRYFMNQIARSAQKTCCRGLSGVTDRPPEQQVKVQPVLQATLQVLFRYGRLSSQMCKVSQSNQQFVLRIALFSRMCNPRSTASSARKATLKVCLTMRTSGVQQPSNWAPLGPALGSFHHRTITNFLHTLLPIEVKPMSVIPRGTDLLEAIKITLAKLHSAIKAADHHWGQLSLPDRHKWEEIVRSSPASKAFTQAYGYSCANKTRYAILTNGIDWWFIGRLKNSIRDHKPNSCTMLNYIAKQALESPGCPLPSPKTFPPSFKSQFPHQTRTLLLPPDSHAPAVLLHVDAAETHFESCSLQDYHSLKVVDLYKMEDGLAPLENELACYHYMEKNNGTVAPRLKAFGMLGNGAFPILGTEWIDGHPLCENDFALFPEVQKAYSNLHSMYIKHGDVDSCNILVTNDKVKLVDFAQATIFDKD